MADVSSEKFLRRAFQENRVAHLCIHNQMAFVLRDTIDGTEDRAAMLGFCNGLAAFTKELAPYAMTVQTQFHIVALNQMWEDLSYLSKGAFTFTPYYPRALMAYDPENLKVSPKGRKAPNMTYVDLVDPDYGAPVLIDNNSNVFGGDHGETLVRTLRANGRDVLLFSGLYATRHACVDKSMKGALENDFTVYVMTDRIFNHPIVERDGRTLKRMINSYQPAIRRIDSASVLRLTR